MRKFKKNSKKVLSAVLALAVVLCSVTVSLSVFANTEPDAVVPYDISYESPAIPMFENKSIDLNNVTVQFAKNGSRISGADITWSGDEASSDKLFGNTFYAIHADTYKLVATYTPDGGEALTQNVWVVVNKAGIPILRLLTRI